MRDMQTLPSRVELTRGLTVGMFDDHIEAAKAKAAEEARREAARNGLANDIREWSREFLAEVRTRGIAPKHTYDRESTSTSFWGNKKTHKQRKPCYFICDVRIDAESGDVTVYRDDVHRNVPLEEREQYYLAHTHSEIRARMGEVLAGTSEYY
jgi:hypothetical protein